MVFESTAPFPRGHRTSQFIGFARRVAGGDFGNTHHLFLEQRDAERARQHFLKFLGRILDGLTSAPAVEIGMHHLSLDRPGADDGHLDHQVVEAARLQARQHGLLRA